MLTLVKHNPDDAMRMDAPVIERRARARHQTTYRPCCVVGSGKISMGLMRNHSIDGAQIEVDTNVSVGDEISYFWEAETSISARVVWREGKTIGVENLLKASINKETFPPRSVRVPCSAEARCWIRGEIHTAMVENISLGGMRLRGLPPIGVGTHMTIEFCGIELCFAAARWSEGRSVGVRFAERLTRETLAQLLLNEDFGLESIEFAD